jgi:predicted transcriptional regulator
MEEDTEMSTTIRISKAAHDALRQVSTATGQTLQATLEQAVELLRRQRFLAEVNSGYARLRCDEAAWAEEQAERDLWESTLADGLEND